MDKTLDLAQAIESAVAANVAVTLRTSTRNNGNILVCLSGLKHEWAELVDGCEEAAKLISRYLDGVISHDVQETRNVKGVA